MISLPFLRYILMAVMRDRVIQSIVVMMLLGMSAAIFLGSTAIVEKQQFTVAAAGTILRMLSVLGLVTFISFFIRRIFESREIDYLLATPLTRYRLLFTFAAAFSILALILAAAIGGIIYVMLPEYTVGWAIWTASVFVEISVTAMISLFFAIVLRSATVSVLCSLGFYSLCRLMGAMIGIIATKVGEDTLGHRAVSYVVKTLSVVVPRFDLLSQSAWLVYGDAAGVPLWILPAQLVVFTLLFLSCAAFDLRRSQF